MKTLADFLPSPLTMEDVREACIRLKSGTLTAWHSSVLEAAEKAEKLLGLAIKASKTKASQGGPMNWRRQCELDNEAKGGEWWGHDGVSWTVRQDDPDMPGDEEIEKIMAEEFERYDDGTPRGCVAAAWRSWARILGSWAIKRGIREVIRMVAEAVAGTGDFDALRTPRTRFAELADR